MRLRTFRPFPSHPLLAGDFYSGLEFGGSLVDKQACRVIQSEIFRKHRLPEFLAPGLLLQKSHDLKMIGHSIHSGSLFERLESCRFNSIYSIYKSTLIVVFENGLNKAHTMNSYSALKLLLYKESSHARQPHLP
jgi:hypothetical protein